MKNISYLLIFTILFSLQTSAQNKNYTSGTTTICSLVSEGDGDNAAKDAPLILYMHDSLQNQAVEIVFTKLMRDRMSYNPYDKLVNQTVCITGKISKYNDAPAIIIRNEDQIKTTGGEQVNRMSANH